MKKLITIFSIILLVCIPAGQTMGQAKFRPRILPTGDTSKTIDHIDGNSVKDGDGIIMVGDVNGSGLDSACFYTLDAAANCGSSTSESPCPEWVKPVRNAGNKCWHLTKIGKRGEDHIWFGNGAWTCDLNDNGSCYDTDEAKPTLGATYLTFTYETNDENAVSLIGRLPDTFDPADETVTYDLFWSSDATSGNAYWCVSFRHQAGDESWSSWQQETCIADATSSNDVDKLTDSTVDNSDVDDWEPGDIFQIKIKRYCTDATDTINSNVTELVGLDLKFDTIE